MKPYNVMQMPPITQDGIVARRVVNGAINDTTIAKIAVANVVQTDAFLEMATHPTDSPSFYSTKFAKFSPRVFLCL